MTYRLRRAPPHYIADDWTEDQQQHQHQQQQHQQHHHIQQQQQQQQHHQAQVQHQHRQNTVTRRKYIDPWDLENYEYIQRTALSSPSDLVQMTPSPAGEPIASTFYYVPGSDGSTASAAHRQRNHPNQLHHNHPHHNHHHQLQQQPEMHADADSVLEMNAMMMDMMLADGQGNHSGGGGSAGSERYAGTPTGCYAGLDEELFYNAKYETIHDEPAYSMYYTDIETASSNEHNSSCGSSSAVSTLQLHTPGFGVRASGRRSIVLPKPEPHIEFPPAPPPHEYYTTLASAAADGGGGHKMSNAGGHQPAERGIYGGDTTTIATSTSASYATLTRHAQHAIMAEEAEEEEEADELPDDIGDAEDDELHEIDLQQEQGQQHFHNLHSPDEAHLPYCSLSNCYACVPENVPVYAISQPATLMRRRISAVVGDELGHDGDGEWLRLGQPMVPPNNFGLSKRGLLQIDYSFNWSNLYRFISQGH